MSPKCQDNTELRTSDRPLSVREKSDGIPTFQKAFCVEEFPKISPIKPPSTAPAPPPTARPNNAPKAATPTSGETGGDGRCITIAPQYLQRIPAVVDVIS